MAEAILELDSETRIFDKPEFDDDEIQPSQNYTSSKVASRVVKVNTETTASSSSSQDGKKTKKQAMEAARKRQEERDRKNKEKVVEGRADPAGVATDRGGIGTGAAVSGVPSPHPVPDNFNIPRRVGTSRSPSREKRSKSPSRRRRSPRRRSRTRSPRRRRSPRSTSRSRSPGWRRRSPSPWKRWSPPRHRFQDRYSRSRSPRRWSPRRGAPSRWGDDACFQDQRWESQDRRWDPGPDRFNPAWGPGPVAPVPVDRNPGGFSSHSATWGQANVPPPPRPMVSLPEDMSQSTLPVPSSDTISSLRAEILGLSQTVKSILEVKSTATKTVEKPEQREVVRKVVVSSDVGGERRVNTTKTPVARSKNKASVPVTVNLDLLAPDSEIDTPVEDSSEEEEEVQGAEAEESSEDEIQMEPEEGVLEWPAVVEHIVQKFPDQIGPEPKSPTRSRITNLGGMSVVKVAERTRLPLYKAIKKELNLFSQDISNPTVKARSKKDSKPLARGFFPSSEKGLPVRPVSGLLGFNHPAQVEADIDRLLPRGKSSYTVQGRFTDENLRNMERDLRINLSSLSYVLWGLEFTTASLTDIAEGSEDADMLLPAISACKHALSFMSTVVDRSSTCLSTTILARRDSYLAQMDPLLPEEERLNLRAADMMNNKLFAGQVSKVVPGLEALRKDSTDRESVNALAMLAKKGVEKQSSAAPSSFKKKKKKEKKAFKKDNAKGTSQNTATDTSAGGASNKRSFRARGKKNKAK